MILDTSFLVDVLRGEEGIDELLQTVDRSGPAQVSSVTIMELWEGIHLADSSGEEKQVVRELLEGVHELPFDRECAMEAGAISAGLRQSGQQIETADVQIGAAARVYDVPVVTNNADHFERIDGIEVVPY
ncbi:PIN domain-containing protein [Halorientalis halophila]|uniref:PIN domain-containing protein n=1 Tax=Halorientalis halophila TaxID=3108499 RepID=UPI00300AF3DF